MPRQCGREAALRSSRAGRGPALAHLRARSLPPGRTRTRSTTKTATATRTTTATRKRPTRAAAKRGKQLELRVVVEVRGDSSTRRPQGLRDIRDAALRPGGRQGRAQREARRPVLDARGPGRTGPRVAFGADLVKGLAAASRRAALALDEAHPRKPRPCYEEMQRHLLGEEKRDDHDVGEKVAENVSLDGLGGRRRLPRRPRVQKKFGEKGREASFVSRLSAALGRAGARTLGARCSSTAAKARRRAQRGPQPMRGAERSAPRCSRSAVTAFSAASASPTPPLKTAWRGARSRRRRAEGRSSRAPEARAAAPSRATCSGLSAARAKRAPLAPGGLT